MSKYKLNNIDEDIMKHILKYISLFSLLYYLSEMLIYKNFKKITVVSAHLISGGEEVMPPFKYPWMVSIRYISPEHKCCGVLISNQYILTAAHCVSAGIYEDRDPPTDFRGYILDKEYIHGFAIELGVHNLKEPLVISEVEEIVKYPTFKISTFLMDIALIKLTYKVPFSEFISPICLPYDSSLDSLDTGIIAGWGQTESGMIENLIGGAVTIWRNEDCLHHRSKIVAPEMICAGGLDGPNICYGDSGGPLFVSINNRYYVIGITSLGSRCQTKDPNLYTRVSAFIDWIIKNSDYINSDEFCGIVKYPDK